jgi:hypothetical protein
MKLSLACSVKDEESLKSIGPHEISISSINCEFLVSDLASWSCLYRGFALCRSLDATKILHTAILSNNLAPHNNKNTKYVIRLEFLVWVNVSKKPPSDFTFIAGC